MKITRVEIQNFRSLRNFDLAIDGRSVFVIGENGGGKTSLLTAIARAFGRDLNFEAADFTDRTQPVEITLTVTGLSATQRAIFANVVDFGGGVPTLRLRARAVWDAASEEADTEHGYARQPGSRSRREERDALTWQWLPAGRDPARMLQFGVARNLIGKLVEELPVAESLERAVGEVRNASEGLGRDAVFEQLLRDARNGMSDLLPAVAQNAFTMGIAATTAHDLLQQFQLVVEHLGEPVPVSTQSSGVAQLSIFVFAIKLAARIPGTILLIDEPEISLHPQAQRALMRAMRQLDTQMIVATHSSNLLDRADPRTIIRLRRTGHSVDVACPTTVSNDDARRLARFTSPQTAEAFFARAVILVEGLSDQVAIEALAERRGRNLDAEGVSVVPIGGVKTITSFLRLYGPNGFRLQMAGLCDEDEEQQFLRGLEAEGLGANLTRAMMAQLGFYVCVTDLEDELLRALGTAAVERIVDHQGDLPAFRVFQQQPTQQGTTLHEQLHRFIGGRRKIEYAPVLVGALNLTNVPRSLDSVIAHV